MSLEKEAAAKVGDFVNPAETITAGQEKTLGIMKHAGTVAGTLMTVGTVLDIVGNVQDNREAKRMKEEQEEKVKAKADKELKKQRKYRRMKRNPLGTSGMALDMFDQATGHTRYGASKLPGL